MQRRSFIQLLAVGIGTLIAGCMPRAVRPAAEYSFDHGVASGDPLNDRVILWTRVSGAKGHVHVNWEVSRKPDFLAIIACCSMTTDSSRDHTVKVDASGLPAGDVLYYRFEAGGVYSPTGRTKTTGIEDVAAASFAVVSCSNHPYGYFYVYRDIAEQDDLDAVIHLGDYIYEYGQGGYATEYAEALGRVPQPPHELLSLEDYRARYAQYRSDPDLQAAHGRHPFIVVWDDHELVNDAWKNGAQNHQAEEGSWEQRRDIAIQAYLEWMPIRVQASGADTRIFRRFDFGKLLSLIMLDTRLHGRDQQPDAIPDADRESIIAAMEDPSRRLLGGVQEAWLNEQLQESGNSTWQMLGQQVMVMPTLAPDLEPLLDLERPALLPREQLEVYIAASKGNPPMILDTWNGYPAARQDLLTSLARHASNPVVISGDLHTAMAGELTPIGMERPVAAEFMTTSVTSPGFTEYLPEVYPGAVQDAAMELNPHVKYMNTRDKGWLRIAFDESECRGEWHLIDGIREAEYAMRVGKRLAVKAGAIGDGLYEFDPSP